MLLQSRKAPHSCSSKLLSKGAIQNCYRKPRPKEAPQNSNAAARSCQLVWKAVRSCCPKLFPSTAPQCCAPKLFSKGCCPKVAILQTCSPKRLPKAILQSGSRKLLPKVATESCPEVVCVQADRYISSNKLRTCRYRLRLAMVGAQQ